MIKKVFLIDDDTDFLDAMKTLLESAGYIVGYESNFRNAVDKVNIYKPDLVILDVLMENVPSGIEIAEKLSIDEELKKIPLVFVSGYFKRPTITAEFNEKFDKLSNVKAKIDKPVKPQDLLNTIQNIK